MAAHSPIQRHLSVQLGTTVEQRMAWLHEPFIKIVQFAHLRRKDSLAPVARVAHMHYFARGAYFGHHSRRVVTDGDQPARVQEVDHIRKKLFARLPLYVVVQSIAKGLPGS